MNCQDIEIHLVDYIDCNLKKDQIQELELHLESCDSCKVSLEETKALMQAFKNAPQEEPSAQLRTSFLESLEEEKQLQQSQVVQLDQAKKEFPWKMAFQIAASLLLLFSGYLVGSHKSKQTSSLEIAALQEETITLRENMMLAMIENQSPSKRIQAVNYTESFAQPDAKILKALIERMQYDGNMNVRLAAAEALSEFPESVIVKDAFIEALTTQKDPSLQIAIIQFLVKIQEKRAIAPMQELLEQSETLDFVKDQVNDGISQII